MGNECCMKSLLNDNFNNDNTSNSSDFLPYAASQEPIFPPELIVRTNQK